MKAGEIQHRLASTNRWWADRHGWAAGDSDLREAARAPFSYTTGVLDDPHLVAVPTAVLAWLIDS